MYSISSFRYIFLTWELYVEYVLYYASCVDGDLLKSLSYLLFHNHEHRFVLINQDMLLMADGGQEL
jgi:hypothetical protein